MENDGRKVFTNEREEVTSQFGKVKVMCFHNSS